MVSVDRTNYVLVISCAYDAAGTLIETIAYIALDEHDHINIGKQLESYMWNIAMYNNARVTRDATIAEIFENIG